MKRTVTSEPNTCGGNREPRKGELNFELKRVITKQCTTKRFKDAVKSVEISMDKLARRFGVTEFECEYERSSNVGRSGGKSWIVESVQIRAFRKRANGTVAIHRVGATSHPHFFGKGEIKRFAAMSAPRDIHIHYGIDDPYDWEHMTVKDIRPALAAKFKKNRAVRKAKLKATKRG